MVIAFCGCFGQNFHVLQPVSWLCGGCEGSLMTDHPGILIQQTDQSVCFAVNPKQFKLYFVAFHLQMIDHAGGCLDSFVAPPWNRVEDERRTTDQCPGTSQGMRQCGTTPSPCPRLCHGGVEENGCRNKLSKPAKRESHTPTTTKTIPFYVPTTTTHTKWFCLVVGLNLKSKEYSIS